MIESFESGNGKVPEYHKVYRDNTIRDVVDVQYSGLRMIDKYGPSRFDPILPGLSHSWKIPISSKFQEISLENLIIKWVIHADNAPPINGEVIVKDISVLRDK